MGLEFRRGSDLQRQGVVFASGEPVWTTDTNVLYVGDGVTAGGKAVTPTALNTTTLVVGYAVTASYALTFNTTTLVLQATTATYAGYAYSFNTNTLVTTATSAAYAYAFNTNTLVTTAVTAYGLGPDIITISNTTPSTTSTSGALIVAGGVGIGGNVSVAGSIIPNSTASNLGSPTNPFGSIYVSPHTINIGTAPLGSVGNSLQVSGLIVTANTASVSTSSGAITIAGGIGIGGSAVVGDTVTATTAVVVGTATSVSTATGALTVAGGVGIGGNLFVGGNVTSTSHIILGTANTNNTLTGALQVAGGVGIGGNLFVGGIITATSIFAQTLTIDYTTVTQSVIVTPDIFTITNTTNASSTISGALVVSGGAGFGGNVYASQLYDNGLRVITGVNPLPSTYIGIQSLTTNSAVTSFTIVNLGVTNITTGTGILVNNATGTVQITLNTSTLMLQAVTATYALTATSAVYAYTFNTGTLVTTAITATYALTATSAAYAYAFNTGTLVSNAVTASALGTGIIAISNATSSTNTSTGALTVAGGVGIGGVLYVANTSYVAGAQIVTSATIGNYVTNFNTNTLVTAAVTATYALTATSAAYAYAFNTSTLVAHSVLADTATIAGSLVGGVVSSIIAGTGTFISTSSGAVTVWISTASTFSGGNVANSTQFTDPTQSISTTTGAVTINGGLGVGGNINAGGRVGIGITATTYLLDINDTQLTGTGIRVQGGLNGGSIATFSRAGLGSVQISVGTGNPQLTFTRAASPTWELGVDATQFVISNGIAGSIDNPVTTDFLTIANTSGVVTIISTTTAISTTTGALKVAGGMGVGGDAYYGGSVYVAGATHYTTGSNTSVVYQYYNTLTNSLDTVFG